MSLSYYFCIIYSALLFLTYRTSFVIVLMICCEKKEETKMSGRTKKVNENLRYRNQVFIFNFLQICVIIQMRASTWYFTKRPTIFQIVTHLLFNIFSNSLLNRRIISGSNWFNNKFEKTINKVRRKLNKKKKKKNSPSQIVRDCSSSCLLSQGIGIVFPECACLPLGGFKYTLRNLSQNHGF